MPELVRALELSGNPFEHYTAETEPNISEYAVKPPYLSTILSRARTPSSFILFGDRGAGKSATRITLFNELWSAKSKETSGNPATPLALHYIDFSSIIDAAKKGNFRESDFVRETAFLIIETTLAWLSSLADDEREALTQALLPEEESLVLALVKTFYLTRPALERRQTETVALKLLNQAWTTRSAI